MAQPSDAVMPEASTLRRLRWPTTILPKMTLTEAIETIRIHSVAGLTGRHMRRAVAHLDAAGLSPWACLACPVTSGAWFMIDQAGGTRAATTMPVAEQISPDELLQAL